MNTYYALIIPVIVTAISGIVWRHRIRWWEIAVPTGVSAVAIFLAKLTVTTMATTDQEYWGGWVVRAEKEEAWDQKVSCAHPVYITLGYDKNHEPIKMYVGDEHDFDVKRHEARWSVVDSNSTDPYGVDEQTFQRLIARFGHQERIELNRDSYLVDGDKIVTHWPGTDETLAPVTTIKSYTNRVQASHEIKKWRTVNPKDFDLFDYPQLANLLDCPTILGEGGPTQAEAERLLSLANAKLGAKKQLRIWVLIFKDKPLAAAEAQYHYWQGGNKNEFVVCVGVNNDYQVQWCKVFSWTEAKNLQEDVEKLIARGEAYPLDLVRLATVLVPELQQRFVRKQFADFSRLTVEPSLLAKILISFITLAVSLIASAWIIHNDFGPVRE